MIVESSYTVENHRSSRTYISTNNKKNKNKELNERNT